MVQIPLIQTLKPYEEEFNVKYFLSLPVNTPYGNLNLTYTEIVIRIECLNELITSLYEEYSSLEDLIKIRGGWFKSDEGFKHKFQTEQIVYWLRKITDEFISLIYLLKQLKITGNYPEKIKISSIGALLKSLKNDEELLYDSVKKHVKFLNLLNDISNGFKHSILNAQTPNYRGVDEPVVFALVAFNDSLNIPKFHQVSLRHLLSNFCDFLESVKMVLINDYQFKYEDLK